MNCKYLTRGLTPCVIMVVVLSACGGGRNHSDLQYKLDSIRKLEQLEQLRLQGIQLESANPFQMVFDSLAIQPLPLRSSAEYVKYLPNFQSIPIEIFAMMGFEESVNPRAITLPESVGARLMLLADGGTDGENTLWLYSIDDDYQPVDKLLLYKPRQKSESDLNPGEETGFTITSDYMICTFAYTADHKLTSQRQYSVDDSRHFVLAPTSDSK